MLRRSILTASALVALASCGGGGSSTASPPVATGGTGSGTTTTISPSPLTTLPEVDSVGGTAALSLQAKFDANGRPAFFFNGVEGAPTIRVHQGDTIALTFVNQLPQYCAVGVESNANLHFHGLSSSPNPPGDDVITTLASPGQSVSYAVHINPDQPPGMYWYHPHAHGLASYEVGNGMSGIIIVEGIANAVPQTAGLRERDIILTDVPNDASYASGEQSVLRRSLAVKRATQDVDSPTGGNACAPETDATPMINGAPLASIGIKPGETELFRVLNASGHRHFDLAIDGRQLQIVAQDGVPIGTYPGAPQTLTVSDWVVPPAGRVEFLVTGGSAPAALMSKCYQSGPAGDTDPEVALGVLTDDTHWPSTATSSTTTQSVHVNARTTAALRQSQYFTSALPAPAQQRTLVFSEDDNGFYINGAAYSPSAAPQIVAQSGTVEQWTLVNTSQEVHAFHIHQTHFIVSSLNGQAQANPHWIDTYDMPPAGVGVSGQVVPSKTVVLIDFRDPTIRGTFLFHCHILDHEDGGMMAKIVVQ
jgi:FtsP/CotA-like multicopper oxidase with cupredoxin domain